MQSNNEVCYDVFVYGMVGMCRLCVVCSLLYCGLSMVGSVMFLWVTVVIVIFCVVVCVVLLCNGVGFCCGCELLEWGVSKKEVFDCCFSEDVFKFEDLLSVNFCNNDAGDRGGIVFFTNAIE